MKQTNPFNTIDALKPSSITHSWSSVHTLQIFGNVWELVDAIAIVDGKYARCKKKNGETLVLEFGEGFDFTTKHSILVIFYPIAGSSSTFEAEEFTDFDYSEAMKAVFFDNKFASTKCVPMVFGDDEFSYVLQDVNLMPNNVAVAGEEVGIYDLQRLQEEKNEVLDEMDSIVSQYPAGTSEAYISLQNSRYAELKAKVDDIDAKIRSLNGGSSIAHISKIVEYSFQNGIDIVLQYGKDTANVSWNDGTATIKHGLNGYVNFVLDGSADYADKTTYDSTKPKYEVAYVDSNTIKIAFEMPAYPVCTLRIFKFGAEK